MRRIATFVVVAILFGVFAVFYFHLVRVVPAPGTGPGVELKAETRQLPAGFGKSLETIVAPSGLAIPVPGVKPGELIDTYTASRGGGMRVHNAIDIMAGEGRPVIAAAPGTVEKLFFSMGGGGITIYVRSEDQAWTYYYAHLSAYAPGLKEGQHVARGALIGFVGHTGDASPDGPHLHFAINHMQPGERWWDGTPINPYPLLAGKPVTG